MVPFENVCLVELLKALSMLLFIMIPHHKSGMFAHKTLEQSLYIISTEVQTKIPNHPKLVILTNTPVEDIEHLLSHLYYVRKRSIAEFNDVFVSEM